MRHAGPKTFNLVHPAHGLEVLLFLFLVRARVVQLWQVRWSHHESWFGSGDARDSFLNRGCVRLSPSTTRLLWLCRDSQSASSLRFFSLSHCSTLIFHKNAHNSNSCYWKHTSYPTNSCNLLVLKLVKNFFKNIYYFLPAVWISWPRFRNFPYERFPIGRCKCLIIVWINVSKPS